MLRAITLGRFQGTNPEIYDRYIDRYAQQSNHRLDEADKMSVQVRQALAAILLNHPSRPDPRIPLNLLAEIERTPNHRLRHTTKASSAYSLLGTCKGYGTNSA